MQKMFVANCTRQVQAFLYRLPENNQPRSQMIAIGGQTQISGDLSTPDIESIIQQYEKYGLVSLVEVKKHDGFAPFVYSLDKPVPPEIISMMVERDTEELQERGREQRKNAAIVMASQIGKQARESGLDLDLEEIRVDVTEDNDGAARDRRSRTGGDRIEEKIVVTREDRVAKRGRGRNRR